MEGPAIPMRDAWKHLSAPSWEIASLWRPVSGAASGVDDQGGPVVLLVGPRGAGKTTSLAKLAVSRVRSSDARPVRLLSLDMSRATAHLQLQSFG